MDRLALYVALIAGLGACTNSNFFFQSLKVR